jgi:hypothetical protein
MFDTLWHLIKANGSIVTGVALSYFFLRAPEVKYLHAALKKMTGWRSQTKLARLEFLVVLVAGIVVVNLTQKGDVDPQLGLASGLSWYTVLAGRSRK